MPVAQVTVSQAWTCDQLALHHKSQCICVSQCRDARHLTCSVFMSSVRNHCRSYSTLYWNWKVEIQKARVVPQTSILVTRASSNQEPRGRRAFNLQRSRDSHCQDGTNSVWENEPWDGWNTYSRTLGRTVTIWKSGSTNECSGYCQSLQPRHTLSMEGDQSYYHYSRVTRSGKVNNNSFVKVCI